MKKHVTIDLILRYKPGFSTNHLLVNLIGLELLHSNNVYMVGSVPVTKLKEAMVGGGQKDPGSRPQEPSGDAFMADSGWRKQRRQAAERGRAALNMGRKEGRVTFFL